MPVTERTKSKQLPIAFERMRQDGMLFVSFDGKQEAEDKASSAHAEKQGGLPCKRIILRRFRYDGKS